MLGQKKKTKKNMIEIRNLVHEFVDRDENNEIIGSKFAVNDVSLEVKKGQFIAILGHNGSGKSTLAKHINALLMPSRGTLFVNGMDTQEETDIWNIRQCAGMVFQNPDNQMVAPIVEEDIGFGPENLGVETEEIWKRVEMALCAVDMGAYRNYAPSRLSGGQKQRVAIAGVLAMKPDCIVLDEPTAMLDPQGRKEVLKTLLELNQKEQVTIILITHHMEEALLADHVFVMHEGNILLQGSPKEVFLHDKEIKMAGLEVPQVTEIAQKLIEKGVPLSRGIIEVREFVTQICKIASENSFVITETKAKENKKEHNETKDVDKMDRRPLICVKDLNYIYSPNSVYQKQALQDIHFSIDKGEYIGIIGQTGSGKSTLIQHLNGLNRATSGAIFYRGQNIYDDTFSRSDLCKKIGLVFQYPEYQLFETTVLKDVCFGPKNMKLTQEECLHRAKKALELVGIEENCYEMSPLELSGGQKRRVAIAGVLAMEPEVLILDEPAAALDPKGRDEIFSILDRLHREKEITIILVSHSMEDVAKYAKRLIVMNQGKIVLDDTPRQIFKQEELLRQLKLDVPQSIRICKALQKAGFSVEADVLNTEEAVEEIYQSMTIKAEPQQNRQENMGNWKKE